MDWAALRVSLWLGAGTIAILLPLGVWFGRLLAVHHFRGKLLVEALVMLPLVLPPTVLGFYLLVTFGARSPLGQASRPSSGSRCHSHSRACCSPLPSPTSRSSSNRSSADLKRFPPTSAMPPRAAAWAHGSGFVCIELPLAWPSVLTAAILTFAHTLGEFGVVLMVGGNLPGETRTLSVAIYDRMQAFDDRSAGIMAATLLVVAVVTLMATTMLSRRLGPHRG